MMLRRTNVNIAGYKVDINGIEVDPEKMESVNIFPTPTNRQDLRISWD